MHRAWQSPATMNNLHLFELINAPPELGPIRLGLAIALAQWMIYGVALTMVVAWVRGDHAARRDLLQMLLAVVLALGIAQIVGHAWPQPRPFVLHLGTQYLEHGNDPGLPSDHVTVLWSLAFAALATGRFAVWAFPLLAMGLVVGWSRVYLGVHFPFDIMAALPVALVGSVAASVLRKPSRPAVARILRLYDRFIDLARDRLRPTRKA